MICSWILLGLLHFQVPLSVPSQPSTPSTKQQASSLDTSLAAMTITTTTATTPNLQFITTSNPATTTMGVGLPQYSMATTNQNAVITPAPVTIERSSPIPPNSSAVLPQQPLSESSSTSSGLGTHPSGGMAVPPLTTTYTQTTSGLPTAPPINFQMPLMMPPTISLGPTPSLQTSHTPTSSAQQWHTSLQQN